MNIATFLDINGVLAGGRKKFNGFKLPDDRSVCRSIRFGDHSFDLEQKFLLIIPVKDSPALSFRVGARDKAKAVVETPAEHRHNAGYSASNFENRQEKQGNGFFAYQPIILSLWARVGLPAALRLAQAWARVGESIKKETWSKFWSSALDTLTGCKARAAAFFW